MRSCRFLALLLVLCLLLPVFAGCGVEEEPAKTGPAKTVVTTQATTAATTEPPPPVEDAFYSVFDNQDYIKQIGRTRFYFGNLAVDWTASGMEFEYQGYGDLSIKMEKTGDTKSVALLAVVDGKEHNITVDKMGVKTYSIATDLPEGVHHVLIRRKTAVENEATGRLLTFNEIQMTGRFLERPADNTYKVAFIGDSITCGVGVPNYNGLLTYAIDLCTRESFDYDVCSVSGIGVYRSTSKHNGTENTMTKYYPYFNYYRSATLPYAPDRKADLVIVNLNTNDYNTGKSKTASTEEAGYKTALRTLISEIREIHGQNVKIVWVVGMMIEQTARNNQWLKDVFNELGGESAGLYRILVATNTSGQDGHPELASHTAVSKALSAFIREKGLLDLPAAQN